MNKLSTAEHRTARIAAVAGNRQQLETVNLMPFKTRSSVSVPLGGANGERALSSSSFIKKHTRIHPAIK